ncbi:MAG: SDR family NAD(P)-dependent oxidoreductase [Bauldia sp.]|nr:SDR family NAD(P)-dependent oxidoreductase [Bauldia sp.]
MTAADVTDATEAAPDFSGRIAVVTGASRGIGRAAALALAKAGAHVVAVARTVGALEELDDEIKAAGGHATLVPLDLKDSVAIDRMGAALYERWGRVDALFGNAGELGTLAPLGHTEPKVWDDVLAVNLTANYRLIRSLDPLLRASTAGRALFVTSGAAHHNNAYWGPYSVSKAGLEALVRTYAAEIRQTNVRVNILDPGRVRTRMRAQAMPGEDPMILPPPEDLVPDILRMLSPDYDENGVTYSFREKNIVG